MFRIVFFGTPLFAKEIFSYLHAQKVSIAAVVTQPDRPKGRSLQLSFSPVKEAVLEISPSIPILQPNKASEEKFLEELASFKADLFVVVAFGQILPQKLLDIPRLGCINVHASLLPKYRGAAPIQRAILSGEKETGVAVQKMVKELDAGDVIDIAKTEISEETTAGDLEKKLLELSKPLLLSIIKRYEKGVPPANPQDASQVSYAPKIDPQEAAIDWSLPAKELQRRISAFSPRPGAFCWVKIGQEKKRLKIFRSRVKKESGSPGKILSGNSIACQSGSLELLEVQLEGKKTMTGSEWLKGYIQRSPEFF